MLLLSLRSSRIRSTFAFCVGMMKQDISHSKCSRKYASHLWLLQQKPVTVVAGGINRINRYVLSIQLTMRVSKFAHRRLRLPNIRELCILSNILWYFFFVCTKNVNHWKLSYFCYKTVIIVKYSTTLIHILYKYLSTLFNILF